MAHSFSVYLLHPLIGRGYLWWSGLGSDLAYVGGLLAVWRHVNCESPGSCVLGIAIPITVVPCAVSTIEVR